MWKQSGTHAWTIKSGDKTYVVILCDDGDFLAAGKGDRKCFSTLQEAQNFVEGTFS